jgi:hypothetical protein
MPIVRKGHIRSELAPPAEAIALARLIVISIYFYSALSKFDYSFLHTLGQQFLNALVGIFGASLDAWSEQDSILSTVEIGAPPPQGKLEGKVAYDEPCHLLHAQKISDPPKQLLRACGGLSLVHLDEAGRRVGEMLRRPIGADEDIRRVFTGHFLSSWLKTDPMLPC